VHTPITAADCNDNNDCTVDTCDTTVGCLHTPLNCDSNNPCILDGCNPNSGCTHQPTPCNLCNVTGTVKVCPLEACQVGRCVPATGDCVYTAVNCSDGNACSDNTCNSALGTNGQCVHGVTNCDDGLACTVDSCNPNTGCVHTPITAADCNDNNNCTIDACVEPTGCAHTAVNCDLGDVCTDYTCNSLLGCQSGPINCETEPKIAALLGNCYTALCNASRGGCYLIQLEGTTVDACGVCNGDGSSCQYAFNSNNGVAVAGGLLAAIVIAIVAVCVAIGIFGGKEGVRYLAEAQEQHARSQQQPPVRDGQQGGRQSSLRWLR